MCSAKTTLYYKIVKCSLRRILLRPEETVTLVEQRCLAVSQMAVRASHLCRVMVDDLLKREKEQEEKREDKSDTIEWPEENTTPVRVLWWLN